MDYILNIVFNHIKDNYIKEELKNLYFKLEFEI